MPCVFRKRNRMAKGGKGGKGAEWPKVSGPDTSNARVLQELKAQRVKMDKFLAQQGKAGGKGAMGTKGQHGSTARKPGWDCTCGLHNFGFRNSCRDCGKSRNPKEKEKPENKWGAGKGVGGTQTQLPGSLANGEEQEDSAQELSTARAMLTAAKGAPECPAQKRLISLWEDDVKKWVEKERRNKPVSYQLKSSLDRCDAKKKAKETAEKAVEDLEKQLAEARVSAKEAQEAEEAEQNELRRLQSLAAQEQSAPMSVDTGDQAQAALNAELLKKVEALASALAKVVAVLPDQSPELMAEVSAALLTTKAPDPNPSTPPKGPENSELLGEGYGKAGTGGQAAVGTVRHNPYPAAASSATPAENTKPPQ